METDQTAPLRTSVPGIGTFKATAADRPPGLYIYPITPRELAIPRH